MRRSILKNKLGLVLMVGAILLGTPVFTAHADSHPYRYTRYDMEHMLDDTYEAKYTMPKFKASQIGKIKSAKDDYNNGFLGQQLNVWDSWVVKNSDGTVANIHGYNVVFGLVGNPNNKVSNRLMGKIGVFYQKLKDSQKGIHSWQFAGTLFKSNTEGAKNPTDETLNHETAEWSGSSVLQPNGKIRLMYTSFSGDPKYNGYGNNKQTLATAQISLKVTNKGLTIDHAKASDRKPVFAGDGKYYETVEQAPDLNNDDHTLRDPQLFDYRGHHYLIFEGNTGTVDPSGPNSLNNNSYYGGTSAFRKSQRKQLNSDDLLKHTAETDNACIGIIELNNDYTVKKVLPPLLTFNLVEDETERPSIIHYQGRWYVFTVMHGWHLASEFASTDDSYLLGFSSKNLFNGYQPLNKHGLVAYGNQPLSSATYTYSYAIQQTVGNPFLLTSYMSQIGRSYEEPATFAPTVKLTLKGQTTKLDKQPLQQGQIRY